MAHFIDHGLQLIFMQVTQVDGHVYLTGDHIARAGVQGQAADGATRVRLMVQGNTVDRADNLRGADQCIFAQVHRSWPGVGLDAGQGQVKPFLPQATHHHANGDGPIFQHRALLDMSFKIGAYGMPQYRTAAGVANTL